MVEQFRERREKVMNMLCAITSQGEGEMRGETDVPTMFQNTADDTHANWAHFRKFRRVLARVQEKPPTTYTGESSPPPGSRASTAEIPNGRTDRSRAPRPSIRSTCSRND